MKKKIETLELFDLGHASRLTRGLSLMLPYYENAAPPYNHYCPFC